MRLFLSLRRLSDKARLVPTLGTYPQGFLVGGHATGVKKNGALDLAIIRSTTASTAAAAVFTTNEFKAAPVVVLKQVMAATGGEGVGALVANLGCANAVTGLGGMADALAMLQAVLELAGTQALVMLTGVIGQRLSMDKITPGIPALFGTLGALHEHWLACAKGIMTTDTFPKLVLRQFELNGITYSMAGLLKGAGMICPNMATLLGFFVTDAPVEAGALQKALAHAVDRLFNCISVDGDMLTNDTIVAMANGAAGGELIGEGSAGYEAVVGAMTLFAQELAQLVVRDGEGATKFVTLRVRDAASYADAKKVAAAIANSALVKTALYGQDANWGRILCATGYAGAAVEPTRTSVAFVPADGSAPLALLVNGEPENVDEARASEILAQEDLEIEVTLGTGGGHSCDFWTCDFSHDYVTINGDYRS